MALFYLPLTDTTPSTKLTLVLEGEAHTVLTAWNTRDKAWYFDITGPLVNLKNIKAVGGKDLLEAYGIEQLGQLWLVDTTNKNTDPERKSFGPDKIHRLLYVTTDDTL